MEIKNLKQDQLIASGPHADVYKQDRLAIKVFKQKRKKTEILYEALVNAEVEETGLPIPRVRDITRLPNKQWIIATQFAEGKNLLEIIKSDIQKADFYIEKFVDIQIEINSKTCPKIIKLKDKLNKEINDIKDISNAAKYEILSRLEGMPKDNKLVHGNFSLSNVIINNSGKAVIVDWIEASQGNICFDIAKTYLLLNLELKDVAEKYLKLYCEKTDITKKSINYWLPIAACHQLKYATKPNEKEMLNKWLDVVQYV